MTVLDLQILLLLPLQCDFPLIPFCKSVEDLFQRSLFNLKVLNEILLRHLRDLSGQIANRLIVQITELEGDQVHREIDNLNFSKNGLKLLRDLRDVV